MALESAEFFRERRLSSGKHQPIEPNNTFEQGVNRFTILGVTSAVGHRKGRAKIYVVGPDSVLVTKYMVDVSVHEVRKGVKLLEESLRRRLRDIPVTDDIFEMLH